MSSHTQRVWVTGANGFLGRAACRALSDRGTAFARVGRAKVEGLAPLPHEQPGVLWDLDQPWATKLPPDDRPTAILHLAAGIPVSFEGGDVERLAADNLQMDRHVFQMAGELGCHVVYASSCSVYGSRDPAPLAEDAVCSPLGPYPTAKLQAEAEATVLADGGKLRFASLRISAPYGAEQRQRTVIWHFVARALAGEDLAYHGSGVREQDFIHARDVGEAFADALHGDAEGIFNVAHGEPITMPALAERVLAQVPGSPSRVTASGQPDPPEVLRARYDITRARVELGWSPRVSLDEGLAECVAAMRAGRP